MDDRLLQSFMTVAECGSFTIAADKLSITQSALSRQIKTVEQTLGVELFERNGKKIRVSPEGEALRTRINEVLIATKNLRLSAEELKKGEAGVLKVGACSQLIERYFPDFLREWQAEHPRVDIRLEEGGGADLDAKLMSGVVQLTINASSYARTPEVEAKPLCHLAVLAIGTPERIGTSGAPIDIAEVCAHPLLLLNRRHVSREMFDAACRLSGLDQRIALESGSPHTVFSMAIGNVGVAVLPSSIRALKTELTVRPIAIERRPVEFEISAIWSRSTPLPAYGRRFVEALAAHIAREQDGLAGAAPAVA